METIYGKNFRDFMVQAPKVRVGIIGTGVDYNHPKIAKHLLHRLDFEEDLKRLEAWEEEIAQESYEDHERLAQHLQESKASRKALGFPRWMDQALESSQPYDRLIPRIPGKNSQHETAMVGRILQSEGSIGLYSVRKAYSNQADENIVEVFRNFHEAGVQVVNLSYSYACGEDDFFENQWRQVFKDYPEMIVVAAAGNDGKDASLEPYCPARYSKDFDNVISVTALNTRSQLASYNNLSVNYGTTIDLATIADDLETFRPNGSFTFVKKKGASSMAAAEVSRVLVEALLKDFVLPSSTLKASLQKASVPSPKLDGKVRSGGVLSQDLFEKELWNTQRVFAGSLSEKSK